MERSALSHKPVEERTRSFEPLGASAAIAQRMDGGWEHVDCILAKRFAWMYAPRMPMLQIRDVPEDLHRELKSRAALAGMSVSEYLLRELRRSLERPTRQELLRRLSKRAPARVRPTPADAVRAERKRR